jgi:hypothetical protein
LTIWPRRIKQTDNLKSEAYLIYTEWEPDRRIPRPERLRDLFPNMDEVTRTAWMADFDQVEGEIWRYAGTGGPRLKSMSAFKKHMTAAFPFMNDDVLGRTWSLAVYYTVHEGY